MPVSMLASLPWTARRLHTYVAYVLAIPLFLTILTGIAYRLLRTAGAEKENVKWLMTVHNMSAVGLGGIYPILLAVSIIALSLSGFSLTYLYDLIASILCCRPRRRYAAGDNRSRNIYSEIARFEARNNSNKGASTSGSPSSSSITSVDAILTGGPTINNTTNSTSNEPFHSASDILQNDLFSHSGDDSLDDDDDDDDDDYDDPTDHSFLNRRLTSLSSSSSNSFLLKFQDQCQSLLPKAITSRWAHRTAGMVLIVPLLITAITGAMYTIAKSWLYLEKEQYRILMYLHEGRYIESTGTVYVFLVGGGLLSLTSTGIYMLLLRNGLCLRTSTSSLSARYSTLDSNSATVFGQPSANTMARIQRAFDINNNADETEDEGFGGTPSGL